MRLDLKKNLKKSTTSYSIAKTDVNKELSYMPAGVEGSVIKVLNGNPTYNLLSKNDVGLSAIDNTSDFNKPVSNATQIALNLKENLLSKGNITSNDLTIIGGTNAIIGTGVTINLGSLGRVRHFTGAGDITDIISSGANIGDIYFDITNGTVYQKSNLTNLNNLTYISVSSGTWIKLGDFTLNKSKVGLGNIDNTSDVNKPISSATQSALNLKANIASPTFTGTVSGIDKSMVGLSSVDNTSDSNKPISTATQTALDTKQSQLNGTGFVKATGSTVSYDNSTYLSTTSASSTYLSITNASTTYLTINNPTSTGTATLPTISNTLGANFATLSGNVGIGTASPSAKLHVVGTAKITGALTLDNTVSGLLRADASGNITSDTTTYLPTSGGTITGNLLVNTVVKVGGSSTLENTYLGESSLTGITTGTKNIAVGKNSLKIISSGTSNTGIGYKTIEFGTTATNNTAIGSFALNAITTAQNNVAIGFQAAQSLTTGQNNIYIGGFSGTGYETVSDSIFVSTGTGTVRFIVDSTGNFAIGTLTPNANSLFTVGGTNKASIPAPVMTQAQVLAIPSPTKGMQVYNNTINQMCHYNGTEWRRLTDSSMI